VIPTIYDVAVKAGVSISTVSLAFNSPERVRQETLQRIMATVDELGFVPKTEAVIRARRGVGRIGVIAPFTSFPEAFGLRLKGVFQGLSFQNREIVVFDQASAATSKLVSLPLTRRVDGLIIMSVPFDEEIAQRLVDQGIPTVLVEIPHYGFTNVIVDHAGGGRIVARHFLDRGHRRFAYIGHRQEHDYPSQSLLKLEGYESALPTAPEVRVIPYSFDDAVKVGVELLGEADRPTAVFAHDDLLASGILKAAREIGLRVPDELAVVGFNDTGLAEPLGLSTVRQPFEESGEIAAQLLLEHIGAPATTRRDVTLGVSLIERETS
jgi:DNA-binding LacI/PurR family transcriptional regulator